VFDFLTLFKQLLIHLKASIVPSIGSNYAQPQEPIIISSGWAHIMDPCEHQLSRHIFISLIPVKKRDLKLHRYPALGVPSIQKKRTADFVDCKITLSLHPFKAESSQITYTQDAVSLL
jgi:hypothetical protein